MFIIENILRAIAGFVTRRPIVVLMIIIGITLVAGWQMTHLELKVDIDTIMPGKDPVIQYGKTINKIFGLSDDQVIIGVFADNVYNPATLNKIGRIVRKVENLSGIKGDIIALPKIKDIRGTADGFETIPLWPNAPITKDKAAQLKKAIMAHKLLGNMIASKDGTATLIMVNFKEGVDRLKVYKQLKTIIDQEKEPEHIYLNGFLVVYAMLLFYIQQVGMITLICVLLIVLVLLWSFRRIAGIILPLATAGLSLVWTLGMMGLFHAPFDIICVVLPIMIIAIGSGHSVQMVSRYYEIFALRHDKTVAIQEAIVKVGLSMIAAGMASAVAFGSLATFDLRSIKTFGTFCAIGIVFILILELTFLPVCLKLLPAPKKQSVEKHKLDQALGKFETYVTRKPAIVLLIAGILLAVGLGGAYFIKVEGNLLQMFNPHSELRISEKLLREKFGTSSSMLYLVTEGKNGDDIKNPEVLHYIEDLENYMKTVPGVGYTTSIADFMKYLNQAMHEGKEEFYVIPESQELVAQYLLLYSMSNDSDFINRVVDFNYQRANMIVMLGDSSTAKTGIIIATLKKYLAQHPPSGFSVKIAGTGNTFLHLNDIIIHDKILNIIQTSVIIFIICLLIFGSLTGALAAIIPLALSVILNFALMGWSGIPLGLVTAIISGLSIGIGADYAIYFLLRFRQEYQHQSATETDRYVKAATNSMLTTGKAIITTALAIAIGFIVLIFSDFGAFQTLGLIVAFSMVTSCIGAMTILPALLVLFKPKFVKKTISLPSTVANQK